MVATHSHRCVAARACVIFCFGLFSIAAQTLLFREFVISFEGHDIAIGFFFAAWFLWVALGAFAAHTWRAVTDRAMRWVELAVLAYIPAFVLEFILILQIRRIAGIEAYALLGLARMLGWSVVVCAPVSVLTGFLFPVLCTWLEQHTRWPITGVYVLEAAGSLVGGVAVTVLLALGAESSLVFLCMAGSLAAASTWAAGTAGLVRRAVVAGLVLACALAGLGLRVDRAIGDRIHVARWTQLLPREAFAGSFATAQAEYLYGTYKDQWLVLRDGSVCEALPDREQAGKVAAIALSQRPKASRILVVGSGLGLCQALLKFPQVQTVDWSYPDLQYVQRIGSILPADLTIRDSRFTALAQDVRTVLRSRPARYDLVIIDLPGAVSAAFNRYYSTEFLECIKAALQPEGLVMVGIPGGENVLGPELAFLGASVQRTLKQVFAFAAVVPGERTFLLASGVDDVYVLPRVLRDRFYLIPGAAEVYPPDALLSVYRPDRSTQVTELYNNVRLPMQALVNHDGRPATYLYGLLLASRQAGLSLTAMAAPLVSVGAWLWLIPSCVLVALRLAFLVRHRSRLPGTETVVGASGFNATFLILSAGWVSIATVIVLMSMVQTLFGSLYLVVGIASSLFMGGLCAGAWASQGLLSGVGASVLLLGTLAVHAAILVVISLQGASGLGSYGGLAVAFVATGLCCGAYLPMAIGRLVGDGLDTRRAASRLQAMDHVGACAGGFMTSIVLIPVAGLQVTGLGLAALVLANVPLELAGSLEGASLRPARGVDLRRARLGYVLFGIMACLVLGSNLLAWAAQHPAGTGHALPAGLESWTSGLEVTAQTASLTGGSLTYFQVLEKGKLKGTILVSDTLAPRVRGYGGPMVLAMYVDPQGGLIDFRMVRDNETPRYIRRVSSWLAGLKGTRIWGEGTLEGVHAVTGATLTTRAVMDILRQSGQRFAQEVLHVQGPVSATPSRVVDRTGIYVTAVVAAGLVVTWWGGLLTRLVVLTATLILGGLWLNSQYSAEQVVNLLAANTPALGLTGTFLLVAGVPALLLFLGNLHCGYVCPFGALQELVGMILPARLRPTVSREALRKARSVKYVVLLVFLAAFFLTRDKTAYCRDLLISVFEWRSWGQWLHEAFQAKAVGILAGLGLLVLGMLLFPRFWCRTLCPAGAFLSLFNYAALLGRWLPAKRFGCCEFGLTGTDHLDCIHCDRCRYGPVAPIPRPAARDDSWSVRVWSGALVTSAVVIGLWLAAGAIQAMPHIVPVPAALQTQTQVQGETETQTAPASEAGQPPDPRRAARIKALIEQDRLSDKEAMFYQEVNEK